MTQIEGSVLDFSKSLMKHSQNVCLGHCHYIEKPIPLSQSIIQSCDKLSVQTLETVKYSFESYKTHLLQIQERELPRLSTFSVRFSKWAHNHAVLAKILCVVSFGFFYLLWKNGDATHRKYQNLEENIKIFSGFITTVQNQINLKPKNQPFNLTVNDSQQKEQSINEQNEPDKSINKHVITISGESLSPPINLEKENQTQKELTHEKKPRPPLPKEILGIILNFLETRQREEISNNDEVCKAAIDTFHLQNEILSGLLDPLTKRLEEIGEFENELKQFKQVKDFFQKYKIPSHLDYKDVRKKILHHLNQIIQLFTSSQQNKLKKLEKIALLLVAYSPEKLKDLDNELRKNHKIVLEAVKEFGFHFIYADPVLEKDREFILAAVKLNGWMLQYTDPALKKDPEIVLAAVTDNGTALQFADPELKKNRDIVLAAVTEYGTALQFADPELKRDRDIVLATVKQNGKALSCADPILKKDKGIIKAALENNLEAFEFIDEQFKRAPQLLESI